MEFQIDRGARLNLEKYVKEDLDIAYSFSKKTYKELGTFIKAIVLFGSSAKKTKKQLKDSQQGDVDILIVVDDVGMALKPEVVETYRIITSRLIHETSEKLHVTTLKLTSFWEYIRAGDPIATNMLRDGVALIDTGFFEPMQLLLRQGRIRPSQEAVWSYFSRAPSTLQNSKWHILQAVVDLYWAVIDSAHAALMNEGQVPTTPEHVSGMIDKILVSNKKVPKSCVETMEKFYVLMKDVTHRKIAEVTGPQYDALYSEAKTFVDIMQKVVENN